MTTENKGYVFTVTLILNSDFFRFDYFSSIFAAFLKFWGNARWRIRDGRHLVIMTK